MEGIKCIEQPATAGNGHHAGGIEYIAAGSLPKKNGILLKFSLDNLYSLGYTVIMITVRETGQFKEWIRALKDRKTKQVINAHVRRISTGNFGDNKPIGDGVSELRIDYGAGFRVYFTRRGDEIVILLCGGDKSTQSRDIEAAKEIAANLEGV